MRHLFTGSRQAAPGLLEEARQRARLAIKDNDVIVVGDADGVDDAVIAVANNLAYTRIEVYGWGGKVRRRSTFGFNFPMNCGAYQRDRVMVGHADKVSSFWNGSSNGTFYTANYARRMGLPVEDFGAPIPRKKV